MSTPVPGWYSDPAGSGRLRWWSGTEWTEQFQDAPAPAADPSATGAAPQQSHGAAAPWAQPEPFIGADGASAGSSRPAHSRGMLIACVASWVVAAVLTVAVTMSLSAFNKAGKGVEESQQGVTDAQQAVDDANALDLSGNGGGK